MKTGVLLIIILKELDGALIDPFSDTDMIDLTKPVSLTKLQNYYHEEKTIHEDLCYNCGFPELGTAIHYKYHHEGNSLKPANIPVQKLVTKLIVIDVSSNTEDNPKLVLTLDDARHWLNIEQRPYRPIILLFKFGWANIAPESGSCLCQMPGIGLDLAVWIAVNKDHIVGVATDLPSMESQESRNATITTVSITTLLAKSGIYMIENVDARPKLPEKGCLAIVTPLKLEDYENVLPVRFYAFCPTLREEKLEIIFAARRSEV